jgi:folate-binding protein YgfZ
MTPKPSETAPHGYARSVSAPTEVAKGTSDTAASAPAYWALKEHCAVVDRSERGKLALTGADALEFLNGQVTNEVAALTPGDGCYAAFLTHKGKMLGDVRVLATGSEVLLDTERVALQALFDMIRRFKLGYAVELEKRTLHSHLFSLLGPRSRAVVAGAAGEDPLQLGDSEHAHVLATIAGRPVRLISTDSGGVDVLMGTDDAKVVWAALVAAGAHAATPADAEIVRVERGIPRYGTDMDDNTIPQEAAINERAVSFTKGCYVGQETVARLFYRGKPNRHLRGLRLSEPVATGAEVGFEDRVVGSLSSSVDSPALGPIGLALLRREVQPGATVTVGSDGAGAEVLTLPF